MSFSRPMKMAPGPLFKPRTSASINSRIVASETRIRQDIELLRAHLSAFEISMRSAHDLSLSESAAAIVNAATGLYRQASRLEEMRYLQGHSINDISAALRPEELARAAGGWVETDDGCFSLHIGQVCLTVTLSDASDSSTTWSLYYEIGIFEDANGAMHDSRTIACATASNCSLETAQALAIEMHSEGMARTLGVIMPKASEGDVRQLLEDKTRLGFLLSRMGLPENTPCRASGREIHVRILEGQQAPNAWTWITCVHGDWIRFSALSNTCSVDW